MWNKIVNFFTAPIFLDDEEKTLRARALHALHINMGGAVAILGTLGILFVFHEKRVASLILIVAFLMLYMEMVINKRGYVKASGVLTLGLLWIMTVVMTSISGGIRSLDIIFFVSGTVIAGIVFGSTGAFFYAGLSILTSLGLILIGNIGVQFPQTFSFPPFSALIILCINLVFTVVPLQVALQSLSESALRSRSNEERYRLIASVMSDYAFSIRYAPNGKIKDQWISGAFEKITGYTVEEYIAQGGWATIVHPDDREQDANDMEQLHSNKKIVTEIRLIKKDGEIRWARSYAQPLWDEKLNKLAGIYGAVQDITVSKQVENDLLEREAILEIAADAANLFLKVSNWTIDIWHTEVDKLLERLGTTIKASHAYIFENHLAEDASTLMTMKYEWAAPGFASDLDDPRYKNLPAKTGYLENWNHAINMGDPYIGDLKHVVREDMEDLATRGIYALLDVPIYIDGTWWGTIGFDDMARAREWSNAEVGSLIVAANLLGVTIKRQQVDATLQSELQQRKALIGELEIKNAESETLRESVAIVATTLERSEAVQRILEQLKRVVAYDSASVWLYKDDKAVMIGWKDLPYEVITPDEYTLSHTKPDYPFWSEQAPYILLDDIQENYPVFRETPINYIHGWMSIPLQARGKLAGFISLNSRMPGKFTEHDAKLALTFASQVSIALENARLYTELQGELFERQKLIVELVAKNAESDTLRESVAIVAATLEKSEAIDRILEQLERVIPFNSASVQLVNGDALEIVSARGFEINKEYKFILNEREPAYPVVLGLVPYILYDDIQVTIPSFNDIPHNNIHAWIAVPLKAKGKITGIITLDGRKAGQFSERDAQLALTYANQVAIALENARLFTELQVELSERQKLINELVAKDIESETLRESTTIVAATLDISETVQRVLDQIKRVVQYDSASIWLYQGEKVIMVGWNGLPAGMEKMGEYVRNSDTPDYKFWKEEEKTPYILVEDLQDNYPIYRDPPLNYIHGWLGLSLQAHGKLIGFIALDSRQSGKFTKHDVEVALTFAEQVSIALDNARLFTELQSELSERQKLIDELEFKNAELERFTYTVSHDLRSPLVTIKGFLGYMERDASQGNMEAFRRDMQRVSSAADRMDNLLRDVLELSRIGRLVNTSQEIPFEDLVREALEIVHGRIDQRGITIQLQLGLPVVYGDKARLTEVLQNLLDNAAKYMGDQKNPLIDIGMDGYDESGNPIFFVRDNGMGIDPQYNERIFGMFDKLDPASEGTGIGLALVKRIIEVHGGRIWLESEERKGATFFFTLPHSN